MRRRRRHGGGRRAGIGCSSDFANNPKSTERHRPYESLLGAAVADSPPSGTHSARDRVVRHEPSIPDGTDELIFAYDAVPMPHEVDEQIEYLWFDVNDGVFSTELTPIFLDFAVLE
ncbi:MAG TPA: hypothetical protein VFO14_17145 [Vicinamibacterales bacterium]|nr:hypothetical protein [Vicinamibacterales bacterium]